MHFNSRPHEEVDFILLPSCKLVDISTHDLTRRSTLGQCIVLLPLFHFNSRPHEEVDCCQKYYQMATFYFNSRPHEEVDVLFNSFSGFTIHFNSRPHEEVDFVAVNLPTFHIISTHDLTRRSTCLYCLIIFQ